MKKCPYCAEEIQDGAIVCRYCGRDLQKVAPSSQHPIQQKTGKVNKRSNLILWTVIIFMCLFLWIAIPGSKKGEKEPTATAKISSSVVVSTSTTAPSMTPLSTYTPSPIPTLTIGLINEPREMGGIVLTVLNAENMVKMGYLTADPGYIYLVLDVTIENVGRDEATPYNPLYFSVKDSDGYEYNATLFAREPSLKSGDLPKGEKVRGYVAFKVRSTSNRMVLGYEPLVLFGGYEPIRIALDKASVQAGQGTPNTPCESCTFECPKSQGEFEFCIVDLQLVNNKKQFEGVVKEYCKARGGNFCKMLFWTDLTYLPDTLPMSDVQVNNQVADYTKNSTTGNDCLKLLSEGNVIYSSNGCK